MACMAFMQCMECTASGAGRPLPRPRRGDPMGRPLLAVARFSGSADLVLTSAVLESPQRWAVNVPWLDLAGYTGLAAIMVVVVLSWRNQFRFIRRVKENRAAGVYADPEFKRRIRPLNIWRYGLVGLQFLLLVPFAALWSMGVDPETLMYVFVGLILLTLIPSHIVDRRWKKLMTDGVR